MAQDYYGDEYDPYRDFPTPQGGLSDAPASGTNWDDIERQLREAGGSLYDPTDLEGIKRNTTYNEPGKAVSLEQALANARGNYDQRRGNTPGESPQQATAQYSGAGGQAGSGDAALSQFMAYLQSQQQQQAQQQAAMREILMGQLGQATQPVSADAPGVREVLGGMRLASQRGLERGRAQAAEQRAYEGYGANSDVLRTDVERMNQQASETEAQYTGDVLNRELQGKRDQVQRLLSLAMSLGDSESARTLQAQLNAIQTQMQQGQFYDQQAFNYAQMNQSGNLQALLGLLNAF
jgi:hypothetical protein